MSKVSGQLLSEEPMSFWGRQADQHGSRDGHRTNLARARPAADPAGRALACPVGGQICALLAVDIAGYTRPDRDDDIRMFIREELYRILEQAFDKSGVPWSSCFHEDRGDGALVIVPPGIAGNGIIDPLPERL